MSKYRSESYFEWLESLKPGDEVYNSTYSWRDCTTIWVVSDVTASQIVFTNPENKRHFLSKRTGRLIGERESNCSSFQPGRLTAEIRMDFMKRRLIAKIRDTKWEILSIPELEDIEQGIRRVTGR
jgi:hypothetical protein